jgi:hypothetical protein
MRLTLRTYLCLPPLALAVALCLLRRSGLAASDPGPSTGLWLLTALDQSFDEEVGKAQGRLEAKRQAARAVIDGRLTSRQAVDRFRDINDTLPARARSWRPRGYTEEGWACRQVLSFVEVELRLARQEPERAQEWASRLEAEFRTQLGLNGASPPQAMQPPQAERVAVANPPSQDKMKGRTAEGLQAP